jgi:hypothetical protein
MHGQLEARVVCTRPWCNLTFPTVFDSDQHRNGCLKVCSYCGKTFDKIGKYERHMAAEKKKAAKIAFQSQFE